ncbi:tetratricopeptide repeat protein [Caldalkalibacillus salinus]|uniref:tetratricopeptide repeat protein n=1 Tax=Caldalkalibacillus salinus TaxID=2803787 RepID=UPI001920A9E7|nr:hypothetical protein [Caldalkalibacillus salinus]
MSVQQVFDQLNQKLSELKKQTNQGIISEDERQQELEALKKTSEEIVEEWLKFEEKLGQYLDLIQSGDEKQGQSSSMSPKPAIDVEEAKHAYQSFYLPKDTLTETNDSAEWTKGKALYDLLMFEHAVPYLEKTVQTQPDFEMAKLYLGHAYLAINETSKAKYYLQFLVDTTSKVELYHLAVHALACLEGSQENYEKALRYFEKMQVNQLKPEWIYVYFHNYGTTLYQLGKYDDCIDLYTKGYQTFQHDWKMPYMLGKVYMKKGDQEAGIAYWFEALQVEEHPSLLKDMAAYFEEKALHQMAAQCYDRLLKYKAHLQDREAWFGLAWNYGLSQQQDKSRETFIKALSLFPDYIELQISYTWMLLFWKEWEAAHRNIDRLVQVKPGHPLVQSLKSLADGDLEEALQTVSDGVLQSH